MRVCLTLLVVALPLAAADKPVDYTREVRPILANSCLACHGPDEKARKAKLRLDVRAEAVKKAIVPGKGGESPLVERVTSKDPDEVMPPAHGKKPAVTAEQAALLKRWIDEGAQVRPALGLRQAGPARRPGRDRQGLGAQPGGRLHRPGS